MQNQTFNAESYATNFLSASKAELIRFSAENGFSFSEEDLIFIQSHFRDQKKALPTYNQLQFFNKIAEIRAKEKTNCAISAVATNSPERSVIIETAKDLLEKKKVSQKKLFGATPLSYASLTASEYLKYIDCAESASFFLPSEQSAQSDYYIHTNNGIPLFSLVNSDPTQNVKSSKAEDEEPIQKSAIALLSPIFEMSDEDYLARAKDFFSLSTVKEYIKNEKRLISAFGLFDILIKETNGILVNLANIPEAKKDENEKVLSLTTLTDDCHGKYVFDLEPHKAVFLDTLAEEYGLRVNNFALRNYSKLFSLKKEKNPTFCFKFDFLHELMTRPISKKYVFSSEANEAIGSKNPVFLTSKKANETRTYSAEKTLSFTKNIAYATSRNLKKSPYKTSAVTVLDAINALVAKGVPKESIKLSIHYALLSQNDDPLELGKNFASILGAYRTMIELCVSDSQPQISYDPSKRSITAIASAKSQIKKLNTVFSEKESFIYFLPICYDSDGIPDYAKYRYILKYFYLLFEKDALLSSYSVNENMTSVILGASQRNNLSFAENAILENFALSRGILVETFKELPQEESLIFIGKNIPYSSMAK